MSSFVSVWESVKRHWVIVLVFTIACTILGLGSSFLNSNKSLSDGAGYSAEAAIYISGYESSDVNAYNYQVSDGWLVGDARRIIVSDEVAGDVRRELGEDISIESPFWISKDTQAELYTHFIFVKATADTEELAMQATNLAVQKAMPLMKQYLPVSSVDLYSEATLSAGEKGATDYGTDKLTPSEDSSELSTLSKKNIVLGFAGGLLISILGVAIYDLSSRKFRSAHDIKRLIDVSVLGVWHDSSDDELLAESVDILMSNNDLGSVTVAGFVKEDKAQEISRALQDSKSFSKTVALAEALSKRPEDLRTIAQHDCILLAVRASRAKHSDIIQAVERLRLVGAPILGAIFIPKK